MITDRCFACRSPEGPLVLGPDGVSPLCGRCMSVAATLSKLAGEGKKPIGRRLGPSRHFIGLGGGAKDVPEREDESDHISGGDGDG